jgi:leucyl aminopeptidase
MKSFLIIISLVSLVSTTPLVYNDQFPVGTQQGSYPGFDLDLNAVRLVQMEGESPVWMTELDKVINQRNSRSTAHLLATMHLDKCQSSGIEVLRHVSDL